MRSAPGALIVHAPQILFLREAGVKDSVEFLRVESGADGGLVMRLNNGDVRLVLVLFEELIVLELLKRAVVDPDVCGAGGAGAV